MQILKVSTTVIPYFFYKRSTYSFYSSVLAEDIPF